MRRELRIEDNYSVDQNKDLTAQISRSIHLRQCNIKTKSWDLFAARKQPYEIVIASVTYSLGHE